MAGNMLPVGLALSGGTAKAVTHVGIIKALVEAEIPIDYITATSGGSMVGAFYASGMPISSIMQVANSLSWSKLIALRFSRLGFVSSKRIQDFVTEVIGNIEFKDLKTPCQIVATDLATGGKRVFRRGAVALAVRASCSIPQIFLPVEIDGIYYVDGGFSEYLPVETLREMEQEVFVIGASLADERSIYRRPRNYLQLAMHVMGLIAKTNYRVSAPKADVLVHPNMENYSPFDFDASEELIELGYNTTRDMIPEIKEKWKRKSSRLRRMLSKLSPLR